MSLYRIVFGNKFRLPLEFQHREYWAVNKLNMSIDEARKKRRLDIQESEIFLNKNETIYKEKKETFFRQDDLSKGIYDW